MGEDFFSGGAADDAHELPIPPLQDPEKAFEFLRVWRDGNGQLIVCLSPKTHREDEGASLDSWGMVLHDIAKNVADAVVKLCRTPDGRQPSRRKVLNEIAHFFFVEHQDPTDTAREVSTYDDKE